MSRRCDENGWLTYTTESDSVEYAPVRHGRWIIDTKFGADVMSGDQMVICSVCGRGIFWGKQTYCPHCGAMMDEEEQDEQTD